MIMQAFIFYNNIFTQNVFVIIPIAKMLDQPLKGF